LQSLQANCGGAVKSPSGGSASLFDDGANDNRGRAELRCLHRPVHLRFAAARDDTQSRDDSFVETAERGGTGNTLDHHED
jgi:hypothetical protein